MKRGRGGRRDPEPCCVETRDSRSSSLAFELLQCIQINTVGQKWPSRSQPICALSSMTLVLVGTKAPTIRQNAGVDVFVGCNVLPCVARHAAWLQYG